MKVLIGIVFSVILLTVAFSNSAEAKNGVYIPEHEYTGFFDNDGIYTVIAGIKNQENFAVIPTLTVAINDGERKFSSDYEFSSIMPHQMLPMKIKLPEITSENPILEPPKITYRESENKFSGGYIIYDDTLVIHDDSSLTGKIRNAGEEIFEDFRIYALIKDKNDKILDVAFSDKFDVMKPGDVFDFKLIASSYLVNYVDYYSCFAFGDDAIMPLTVKRGDDEMTFRYTANAWFKDAVFDSDETTLTMYSLNGFQMPVMGSFEFPTNSINEKYEVVLDGERFGDNASSKDPKIKFTEQIQSLQSIDEMGNWHLYFEVPSGFQGNVTISGFLKNDGSVTVPDEIDLTNLVYYEITGGEVKQIIAKPNDASLQVLIDSETDGHLLIKTNEFLLRPFANDEYVAVTEMVPELATDEKIAYIITDRFSFDKGKTITIPFSAGTEKIEIFGSYVVPEFGHIVMIILVFGIIGMIVLSKKTNSITNLFYNRL
jgi:predicted secreted protein with PEFG-CTERM motif